MGEVTVSGVIPDGPGPDDLLCRCNAAVGGIFVTCLMNVVTAR
jgi:hypothetical protein